MNSFFLFFYFDILFSPDGLAQPESVAEKISVAKHRGGCLPELFSRGNKRVAREVAKQVQLKFL
jgi:hypothetical protein